MDLVRSSARLKSLPSVTRRSILGHRLPTGVCLTWSREARSCYGTTGAVKRVQVRNDGCTFKNTSTSVEAFGEKTGRTPGNEAFGKSSKTTTSRLFDWLRNNWKKLLLGPVVYILYEYDKFRSIVADVNRIYERYKPFQCIPRTKQHYIDRKKERKELDKEFERVARKVSKGPVSVYLTGAPGSGKTQFGLGYAESFYRRKWFHCFKLSRIAALYLDASNLDASCHNLLKSLSPEIDIDRLTPRQKYNKLVEELSKHYTWLLVVDNANSSDVVPKLANTIKCVGRILVVTSNQSVIGKDYSGEYELGGMTPQEAVDLLRDVSKPDDESSVLLHHLGHILQSVRCFLKKVSGRKDEDDGADALVHRLKCIPLSITSTGVYVRKKRSHDGSYSFKNYPKQSRQVTDTADELAMDDCYIDKTMKTSVRNALLASLEGDKDDTLKKVFTLLACCADSPVPMTLIARLLGVPPHDDVLSPPLERVRKCYNGLLDCSSVSWSTNTTEDIKIQHETVTVNSCTRSVLREDFKDATKAEFHDLLRGIRRACVEVGLDDNKNDTAKWYDVRRNLIPHMEAIQKITEETKDYDEDPQLRCQFMYVIGQCYARTVPEELSKAESYLENALRVCPAGYERLDNITCELGGIKRRQGCIEESLKLFHQIPTAGTDTNMRSRVADEISKLHNIRGDFEKVREVLEARLKEDGEKVLTEKKRSSLNAQVGVALVWLGEGEKAKQYLEMALGQPYAEEIMSPEDYTPQKLRPMMSLARVYQLMGKYPKSLDVLKRLKELNCEYDKPGSGAAAILEGRLSTTHLSLNNKAESLQHAKDTLNRVSEIQEVDPNNIGITIALACLGPVYEEMDGALLKEAETALEIAAKNGGDRYFHQTRLLSHLGWVKHLRRDTKEARKILEEVEKKNEIAT